MTDSMFPFCAGLALQCESGTAEARYAAMTSRKPEMTRYGPAVDCYILTDEIARVQRDYLFRGSSADQADHSPRWKT